MKEWCNIVNTFAFGNVSTCGLYDTLEITNLKHNMFQQKEQWSSSTKLWNIPEMLSFLVKCRVIALEFSKCSPLPWKINKRNPKPYILFPWLTTLIKKWNLDLLMRVRNDTFVTVYRYNWISGVLVLILEWCWVFVVFF